MLFNRDKIILDLCGGTGAWSKPYADAEYDVKVITLPEQNVIDYIPPENVYGILAAPDCTEFSLARNAWPDIPRDFLAALPAVDACIRNAWRCKPKFWALENPVCMLSRWLGTPAYIFEPWWFGDPWTKKTALWGDFKSPKQLYFEFEDLPDSSDKPKWIRHGRKLPGIACFTSGNEKEKRAITPAGFAKAFFEANP